MRYWDEGGPVSSMIPSLVTGPTTAILYTIVEFYRILSILCGRMYYVDEI